MSNLVLDARGRRAGINRLYILAIFAAAFFWSRPAHAQLTAITGKCTDAQGHPIAHATVVFHRTDIFETYKVKTNAKGEYAHYGLPLGVFNIVLLSPKGVVLAQIHQVQTQMAVPRVINFNLRKMAAQSPSGPAPPPTAPVPTPNLGVAMAQAAKVRQLTALFAQHQKLRAAKQWPQAIGVARQALALAPGSPLLISMLGQDELSGGQVAAAVADFQKASALAPAAANYLMDLGRALNAENHPRQAMAAWKRAGKLDPNAAKIELYNQGVKFYNQSAMPQAAAALGAALKLDPTLAPAWFYRGMALLSSAAVNPKTGAILAPPAALIALKKYLQLQPQGPNAAVAQATLQQLAGKVQTSYSKHLK